MKERIKQALGLKTSVEEKPLQEHRRLHEIYFPKNLHAVIRRERARADRQRGQFSLVMFRLMPARGRLATLRLARLVLNEVRTTDEVGQFDDITVCAILPETTPDGAAKLIDRVGEQGKRRGMSIEPVLYTYPFNWFKQEKDGDCDDDENTPPSGGIGRGAGVEPAAGRVAEWIRRAEESGNRQRVRARPLEELLARPPSIAKRAIDTVAAGLVLLMASPVLAVIAIAIKTTSSGPVIFKQYRTGLGGRPFQIWKFRTMCNDAEKQKAALRAISEQDGPAFKLANDPRVTRVGALLRKTSLDELPQLWNVLRGDMSLVGPRPLPIDEQALCDQWHRGRLDVMPGLTCIWQVEGRSRVSFEEWMRMDLGYIRTNHVWRDIRIMLATVPAVLLRRGAK